MELKKKKKPLLSKGPEIMLQTYASPDEGPSFLQF